MHCTVISSPPLHDYINFKNMQSNEILLNLKNSQMLRFTEIMSGIHVLAKRVHNYNEITPQQLTEHEWVKSCFTILQNHIAQMNVII
jgi:hypothetical protein